MRKSIAPIAQRPPRPLGVRVSGFVQRRLNTLDETLRCPVWVSMATRNDFTDHQGPHTVADRPNWRFHTVWGGALPYFEDLAAFTTQLDPFWRSPDRMSAQ